MSKIEELYMPPIYKYFVESNDFNGIPMEILFSLWGTDWKEGIQRLLNLIEAELCTIQSSTLPHIIRNVVPTKEASIKYLSEIKDGKTNKYLPFQECVYPSSSYLKKNRDTSCMSPYYKFLALGGAQLQPIFFDFNVLNTYLEDPRYKLNLNDYYGSLSYELTEDSKLDNAGYYYLKTFGIGYDDSGNRVITAFPRDLKFLSPSHQNIWEANEILKPCKVLKFYWDNVMTGSWNFPLSISSAILIERKYVNKLWNTIFGENLFLNDYSLKDLPSDFSFLFRPTKSALGKFVHTMDKLFSDELNKKHLIALLKNGSDNLSAIETEFDPQIGSLNALELWLNNIYILQNGERIGAEIVAPFKKIRKLRQPQAHKIIIKNDYDIHIYKEQNEIFCSIYEALKKLRIVLTTHPKAVCVSPPDNWSEEVYEI